MKMKKCKEIILMILPVLLVVILAGAFFMDDKNAIAVYASNDGIESGGTENQEGVLGEEADKEAEEGADEDTEEKGEGEGTVSGNELEEITCTCTDKCTTSRKNAECVVCAEDYEKCEYITPRVRISISSPNGWYRFGSAEVKVSVEDIVHSPDFVLEKVEARIGQNGSYMDITDTLKVRITEDCSIYVSVTDTRGRVYEENRSIRCFDKEKPSLNAGISGGTLTIQAVDNDSGVKAVFVNGQKFTELTNGTVHIRLQEADSAYENFSIQAMDNAGNVSEIYSLKNPYYKNTDTKDEDGNGVRLPESVLPTQAVEAKADVVDYVNTADEGNADESKTETVKMENVEDVSFTNNVSGSGERVGKEFYMIQTDSGKIFYLIIDNTKSDNNVYFLTEISENDLLHVTGTNYQVLEPNQAATESALPDGDEKKDEDIEKEEKAETDEEADNTAPEDKDIGEKRSPAIAYTILILLGGAVAGGIYFFKTYRRAGEDFVDDEEEDEEIYEKEDEESYISEDLDNDIDDSIENENTIFYEDDE